MIYCRLGDKERAFEFLEQGYQERTRGLVYLQVETAVRSDPQRSEIPGHASSNEFPEVIPRKEQGQ